ncbi:MAG: hypothetical protein INR70_17835 [Parafilimonas terrae]|nr:hypothetical protein [Parafilimonas terrae]
MARRYNPKPPTSLEDCIAAFDAALEVPTYGADIGRWPAYVDRDLQTTFRDVEWLGVHDFVARYQIVMATNFPQRIQAGELGITAYRSAGNALHWGMRLGLLERRGESHDRNWRVIRREATYVIDYRKGRGHAFRKVRGLPPEEQAQIEREQRRNEALCSTLDRKARSAFPSSNRLNAILEHDRGYVVPPTWASRGPMPSWTVGRELRVVFGIAIDAHEVAGLTRRQLKHWASLIDNARIAAEMRAFLYAGQTPLPFEAEPEPGFHPDDAEALAGFAHLGGL